MSLHVAPSLVHLKFHAQFVLKFCQNLYIASNISLEPSRYFFCEKAVRKIGPPSHTCRMMLCEWRSVTEPSHQRIKDAIELETPSDDHRAKHELHERSNIVFECIQVGNSSMASGFGRVRWDASCQGGCEIDEEVGKNDRHWFPPLINRSLVSRK